MKKIKINHFMFAAWIGILSWTMGCVGHGIELHDAGTDVDTLVIDTKYGVEITPSTAPIPFTNFRYPYIDDKENVTFIGNDPFLFVPAIRGNGIYRSYAADGKLESLVIQDDLAPDDGFPIGAILGLRTDFDSYVFRRLASETSLYGSFHGEPLVTIANTSSIAPGLGKMFSILNYADVFGDLVVFNGGVNTDTGYIDGLYLYQYSKKKLTRLLDSTLPVSALGGAILTNFSFQPRLDGDWLVFSASESNQQKITTPRKLGVFGWRLQSNGDPSKMFTPEKLQVLAPLGMEVPKSGGKPMTYGWCVTSRNGWVAADVGSASEGHYREIPKWQAICIRSPEGVWRNPIDTNTINPILNDGSFFTGFNKWVGLDEGKVIFRAYGLDYEAVYIYDAIADLLYFVADTRLSIAGKRVREFEISSHPLVGKRLALMIYFEDSSSGVYLATLPKIATKMVRKLSDSPPSR